MKVNLTTNSSWPSSSALTLLARVDPYLITLANGSDEHKCPDEEYETTYQDLMVSSGATQALYYVTLSTMGAAAIRVSALYFIVGVGLSNHIVS